LKKLATLYCVFLLLLLVISPFTSKTISRNMDINTWFLGIDSRNPSIGVAMKAYIQIHNSTRYKVFIHGVDFDESVLNSFILAGYAIKYVCGIDVDNIAVDIYLSGYTKITGPSASLAYAIAILKMLNRFNNTSDWGATGVVSIDGFIDAVGGLDVKIKAARENNIETIYIPTINRPTELKNNETIKLIKATSLIEFCRKQLGYSTSTSIEPSTKIFNVVNEFFINETRKFLNKSEMLINESPLSIKENLSSLYRNFSIDIQKAVEKRHGYTAVSLAFTLYMQLLYKHLIYNDSKAYSLIQKSRVVIDNALNEFNRFRYITPSTIPILIIILDRISEAQYYIDLYKNLTKQHISAKYPPAVLEAITRAYSRSLTIDTWLNVLKIVNNSVNERVIPFNKAYNVALNTLKAISSVIEWNQDFAPLSLSAIASIRGNLAAQLDNSSQLIVVDNLKELYRIFNGYLSNESRVIPYIYYIYAEDLEQIDKTNYVALLSMSTLIAATTNIINNSINKNVDVFMSSNSIEEINILLNALKNAAILLNALTLLLLIILLLYITKKGFRYSSSTTL